MIRKSAPLGAHTVTIETGRMAKQAGGSVIVSTGETSVLVTACVGPHKETAGFFPLSVEYIEKFYASGRIPGGFKRREGQLSEAEILTCRLSDRPLRPLFPEGFKGEVQVIAQVISHDSENDADVLSITGASAALMLSNAPFSGPIAAVRVGRIEGKFVANPTWSQRPLCDIDVVIACTKDAIVMVEGEADEASEDDMLDALNFGFEAVQPLIKLQIKLAKEAGKEKMTFVSPKLDAALLKAVAKFIGTKLSKAMAISDKLSRYSAIHEIRAELGAKFTETHPGREREVGACFEELESNTLRDVVIKQRKRIDGRGPRDVRPITVEVGVLPRPHGSSLFTRGETQTLVTVTLGTDRDAKLNEDLHGKRDEHFMLHYNFPPFSVGEVKRMGSPGRREVGHGFLARRSVEKVVPSHDKFPYTIRVVSEVLESNGSSSMASVCGGSLALMHAGVPIKAAVAGIAMGLIKEGDDYVILSDILGDEDHLGDMDFKVAGTERGITGLQMDIKINGISRSVMSEAMLQAREGRLHILGKMNAVLSSPNEELSPYAPRITTIKIAVDRIRDVIGSGGKTIRAIQEKAGVTIEVQDNGTVKIASTSEKATAEAIEIIKALTAEAVVGEIYLGTVAKVAEFGAFVTILPGVDGLCHISELSDQRVERTEDICQEGDEIVVKCMGVERNGKIRLSRKEALGKTPTVAVTKTLDN
ncbi:MAG: polyribonucleotide nucleotidyltransferase [Deltaproteobacteria bacterium]|nr:polyribonucleotide nucleotidyltransferase [Deltaproteobacteria bacterium]